MITRIITALIGLPIFIGLLYMGEIYTNILVFLMIIAGAFELNKIFEIKDKMIFILLSFYSLLIFVYPQQIDFLEISVLYIFSSFIYFLSRFSKDPGKNKEFFITLLKGLFIYFYVVIPLYHLVLLRNLENGFQYLIFMFLIIWTTDSFAYFTGKFFGKNKLAPIISPKKTIEGSLGGSFSALIMALIVNHIFVIFPGVSIYLIGISVLFLTVISQLGDLFESSIKRIYNVKDSGKILPGHGGVLDRFDSTIFTAPIFYLLISLIN